MPALFAFTTGNKQFGPGTLEMFVFQTTPSGNSTFGNAEPGNIQYSGNISVPWPNVPQFCFLDVSPNAHSLSLFSYGSDVRRYEIIGNITPVVRTPESSNTALLLSLGFVPLFALCPVKRRTRQV